MSTALKLLDRAGILNANDVVFEDVPTPEWAPPGTLEEERKNYGVRIRNLTGTGRGAFIQESMDMKRAEDNNERVNFEIEMLLVAMTAVDENNALLFTRDDVEVLGGRNAHAIARCAGVAQRLSALDKAAQEQAAKNSQPAAK